MKSKFSHFLLISSLFFFVHSVFAVNFDYPEHDPGPDMSDPMQAELVEILSDLPYVPGISTELQVKAPTYKRGQKMRPEFGAMPIRGFALPNSVQVLVIGQDATHIAEGANRPGIAGFGGRVQDMLSHFGVFEGVVFTNLYVNTISGQYGSRNTPMLYKDRSGKERVVYRNLIENRLWLMTHEGAYAAWRNRFISWVIRNNQDSLKLIITLGNAGRDAVSNYINSIGGVVGTYTSKASSLNYNVPVIEMVPAGGNNEWAIPVTKEGKDVASVLLSQIEGRRVKLNYKKTSDQAKAKQVMNDNLEEAKKLMVFTQGGPQGNGVLNKAQLGGWDLNKMKILGKKTRLLEGLYTPDEEGGKVRIGKVAVVHATHPTALSMLAREKGKAEASESVEKKLITPLREAQELDGWEPPSPEPGATSPYLEGLPYKYGRARIPKSHGDPGITDLRLLPVSTAGRINKKAIVIGTRDRGLEWGDGVLKKMTKETKHRPLPKKKLALTGRPLFESWQGRYDRGPDDVFTHLLFVKPEQSFKSLYKTKSGMSYSKDGISAYDIKSHPDAGDFGHYRGTFDNPRVVILADPQGYDPFITSKALTGSRGQYLHGLMENLRVGKDYLVLQTVPFAMDGASQSEWKRVLKKTTQYREDLLNEILKRGTPELIIADGSNAHSELRRWLAKTSKDIPYQYIRRGKKSMSYDIVSAGKKIVRNTSFKGKITGHRDDIPREHLTWIARVWEGTSGDRVITAQDLEVEVKDKETGEVKTETLRYKGKAFAIVAPDWATQAEVELRESTQEFLKKSLDKLEKMGFPLPGEKLKEYLERKEPLEDAA